jgi:sulfonate transport system substrate-binding protein
MTVLPTHLDYSGYIYRITRMNSSALRSSLLAAALLLPLTLLAACGSSSATGTTTTGAAGTTSSEGAATIPAGTVLRVGEQLHNLSQVLILGHQDAHVPYSIQYSEFVGGPPMLQAFEGGAVDVGYVFSTPLIYAQSAHQDLTAVATWSTRNSGYSAVTAPGTSIRGWAGLRGKRVAYQAGTASEAVLLEGLQSAGLTLSDVTSVNLPVTQTAAALEGHSADVGITVEPLLSSYLQANPTAKVVAYGNRLTDKSGFLIASSATRADKARSAALADFITRLIRAYVYLDAHPSIVTQAIFVDQYHLSPTRAAEVAKFEGTTTFGQLPGQIVADQQHLADLLATSKVIPSEIDVAGEFDGRFNALVRTVQGQGS